MTERNDCVCCPDCGLVNDWATEQIRMLERELRSMRSKLARLEGERAKSPKQHAHYREAMEVLEFWRQRLAPRTKTLNGKRLIAVLARFDEGYDKTDLELAVMGYVNRPYVTRHGRTTQGSPWERRVEATLIFRDPEHVEQGWAMAGQVHEPRNGVERLQLALGA